MNLEGKLLGNRYELISVIGNGGMATVYKAKDLGLKRHVAVKILRDEFTTDEEFIKRFECEAQSAATVTHPNIVSVYDGGVDGNLYYIVMELVKGKTLKEIITEEKAPIPWKWSVNIAKQIASALEEAHKNNIVHRDIKPHNIIITEDGVAKVTDFGIAKAVSNSTITAFGTTLGSVHYFSPEHAKGGYTDAKSDIYSLGVVLYEMVTGKVPFDSDTPVSVALKHMQEEPIEPRKVNPKVPRAINLIILKAMKKETVFRYQTATEMLSDLKQSLKDPEGTFIEPIQEDMYKTQVLKTSKIEEKQEKNQKEKKLNKKKIYGAIGLIFAFIVAVIITVVVLINTKPKQVKMPNVVGLTRQEAQAKIQNNNLIFEVTKEEFSKDVEEGLVISQDPEYLPNYNSLDLNSKVKVVISKGQEKVIMTKVVGKKKDEAIADLAKINLKTEIVEATSETVEAGIITEQSIEENAEILAGETVTITVSTGSAIKKVEMVNVIGKSEEDAVNAIEDLGLKVVVEKVEDFNKTNGVIVSQSIEKGAETPEKSTVTITVNKYDVLKTVPFTINLKTITGGYTVVTNNTKTVETTEKEKEKENEKENENENEGNKEPKTQASKANITIEVAGVSVYSDSGVDKNKEDISGDIPGRGIQNVVVIITDAEGGKWSRTQSVDFNTVTKIEF